MSKVSARVFSREFKLDVVRRLEAESSVSALADELGIRRTLLNQWRDAFRRGETGGVARGFKRPRKALSVSVPAAGRAAADPLASARERIAAPERKVGQQKLELDFFKRALRQVEASRRPSDVPGGTASTPLIRAMTRPQGELPEAGRRADVWARRRQPCELLPVLASLGAAPGKDCGA